MSSHLNKAQCLAQARKGIFKNPNKPPKPHKNSFIKDRHVFEKLFDESVLITLEVVNTVVMKENDLITYEEVYSQVFRN